MRDADVSCEIQTGRLKLRPLQFTCGTSPHWESGTTLAATARGAARVTYFILHQPPGGLLYPRLRL